MLNGTGKVGVAAYWKRFLQGKGFTNVVMADYKGEINDHTVVYVTAGGNAPKGVYDLFPNAEYREEGLDSADPNADTNVKIPDSQKKFGFNVYTGEILWTNSDARFGVTMFDENGSGSLYVASWYENTLCIISSDGTTLAKIDNLKPDGLDSDSVPSSMRLVDNQTLEVTYWNGEVIYVDLSNYIRLG